MSVFMDKRGWMILRVLINRYNPKAGNALLKFLPAEDSKAVMSQDIRSTDLAPILQKPQRSLAKIHYSWIQPVLQKFPESLQPSVMAALASERIVGLKIPSPIPISDMAKTFIFNQIYQQLKISEHFPIEYLPESELSLLAKWSKAQLMNLADFLGLYDLAAEVSKIVNRNYLKNIYTCLSPKQFHYLKVCLHQKEQLISPKLGIDPTKQDCTELKQVMHRRGLIRLGKALCGQHPDLVWHIAHTLDTGRGNLLFKEYQPEEIPKVTRILKQQVLNLVNFLKSE
jgi:hypothetical protein